MVTLYKPALSSPEIGLH